MDHQVLDEFFDPDLPDRQLRDAAGAVSVAIDDAPTAAGDAPADGAGDVNSMVQDDIRQAGQMHPAALNLNPPSTSFPTTLPSHSTQPYSPSPSHLLSHSSSVDGTSAANSPHQNQHHQDLLHQLANGAAFGHQQPEDEIQAGGSGTHAGDDVGEDEDVYVTYDPEPETPAVQVTPAEVVEEGAHIHVQDQLVSHEANPGQGQPVEQEAETSVPQRLEDIPMEDLDARHLDGEGARHFAAQAGGMGDLQDGDGAGGEASQSGRRASTTKKKETKAKGKGKRVGGINGLLEASRVIGNDVAAGRTIYSESGGAGSIGNEHYRTLSAAMTATPLMAQPIPSTSYLPTATPTPSRRINPNPLKRRATSPPRSDIRRTKITRMFAATIGPSGSRVPEQQMSFSTISILHGHMAQKSYGKEKRFLCPPPIVRMTGNTSDTVETIVLTLENDEHGDDLPEVRNSQGVRLNFERDFDPRSHLREGISFPGLSAVQTGKLKALRLKLDVHQPGGTLKRQGAEEEEQEMERLKRHGARFEEIEDEDGVVVPKAEDGPTYAYPADPHEVEDDAPRAQGSGANSVDNGTPMEVDSNGEPVEEDDRHEQVPREIQDMIHETEAEGDAEVDGDVEIGEGGEDAGSQPKKKRKYVFKNRPLAPDDPNFQLGTVGGLVEDLNRLKVPDRPWARFLAPGINIVSKPSRQSVGIPKLTKAMVITGMKIGDPFALWSRPLAQTVMTRYLFVDVDTSVMVGRNGDWTPWVMDVVTRGEPPGGHDAEVIPADMLTYGSMIVLRDTHTGFRTEPLLLCKVINGIVHHHDYGPVSELHRIALAKIVPGQGRWYLRSPVIERVRDKRPLPKRKRTKKSAKKGKRVQDEFGNPVDEDPEPMGKDGGASSELSEIEDYGLDPKRDSEWPEGDKGDNAERDDGAEGVAGLDSAAPALFRAAKIKREYDEEGREVEKEYLDDYSCWIISGITETKYTFFEGRHEIGDYSTVFKYPLTPLPTIIDIPEYRFDDNTITLTVTNFFYDDDVEEYRGKPLNLYLGAIGPLRVRAFRSVAPDDNWSTGDGTPHRYPARPVDETDDTPPEYRPYSAIPGNVEHTILLITCPDPKAMYSATQIERDKYERDQANDSAEGWVDVDDQLYPLDLPDAIAPVIKVRASRKKEPRAASQDVAMEDGTGVEGQEQASLAADGDAEAQEASVSVERDEGFEEAIAEDRQGQSSAAGGVGGSSNLTGSPSREAQAEELPTGIEADAGHTDGRAGHPSSMQHDESTNGGQYERDDYALNQPQVEGYNESSTLHDMHVQATEGQLHHFQQAQFEQHNLQPPDFTRNDIDGQSNDEPVDHQLLVENFVRQANMQEGASIDMFSADAFNLEEQQQIALLAAQASYQGIDGLDTNIFTARALEAAAIGNDGHALLDTETILAQANMGPTQRHEHHPESLPGSAHDHNQPAVHDMQADDDLDLARLAEMSVDFTGGQQQEELQDQEDPEQVPLRDDQAAGESRDLADQAQEEQQQEVEQRQDQGQYEGVEVSAQNESSGAAKVAVKKTRAPRSKVTKEKKPRGRPVRPKEPKPPKPKKPKGGPRKPRTIPEAPVLEESAMQSLEPPTVVITKRPYAGQVYMQRHIPRETQLAGSSLPLLFLRPSDNTGFHTGKDLVVGKRYMDGELTWNIEIV